MSDLRFRLMQKRNADLRRKQQKQEEKQRQLRLEEEAQRKSSQDSASSTETPKLGASNNTKSPSKAASTPPPNGVSTTRKNDLSSDSTPRSRRTPPKESPIKSLLRGEQKRSPSSSSGKQTRLSFDDSSPSHKPSIDKKWLNEPRDPSKCTKLSFDDTPTPPPKIDKKWLEKPRETMSDHSAKSALVARSPIQTRKEQRNSSSLSLDSGDKQISRRSIDKKWLDPPKQKIHMWGPAESRHKDDDSSPKDEKKFETANDNDSDSDDSFDLLGQFEKDRAAKSSGAASPESNDDVRPPQSETESQQSQSSSQRRRRFELYPGEKKDSNSESSDSQDNRRGESGSGRLSSIHRRPSSRGSSQDNEDNSLQDSDNNEGIALSMKPQYESQESSEASWIDKSSTTRKRIPKRRTRKEEASDDYDDDDSDQGNNDSKVPHNPIALQRQQEEEQARLIAEQNMSRPKTASIDDDDLWNDSEFEEIEKDRTGESKSKNRGGYNSKKKTTTSSKKQRRSTSPNDIKLDDADAIYDDQYINMLAQDEDRLKSQLHPQLSFTPFEPGALEPLILKNSEGKPCAEIPAALSRYLAPFQKIGVQFMFRCLSAGTGSIMGDEMGLGKTLQVLALLAALYGKSGTNMDLATIQERSKTARNRLDKIEKEKERALLAGQQHSESIDWKTELKMPLWYPVLILVPPTLIENWKNEFKKFAHFSVAVYRDKNRAKALKQLCNGTAEVLLTGHSTFRSEKDFKELNKVAWKLVVIDEFHMFKGVKGQLALRLRELKGTNPTQIVGMTGTLMQNDHKELWNLVDLVETNYLGSWEEFESQLSRPIKMGRTKTADPSAIQRSVQKAAGLSQKLAQIMIDRKKEEVLKDQLPEKSEQVVFCELSALQKRVYRHVLQLPDFEMIRTHSAPCDCSVNAPIFKKYHKLKSNAERVEFYRRHKQSIMTRKKCCYQIPINPRCYDEGQPRIDPDAVLWRMYHEDEEACERCPLCCMFPAFAKLNKVSSHLALLQPKKTPNYNLEGSPEHIAFMKDHEFAKVALPRDVVAKLPGASLIRKDGIMDSHFSLSGKLKVLDKLLGRFQNEENSKTLIFSYSTQTLDLIQNYVKSKGYTHDRMDGDTNLVKRQHIADNFNSNQDTFLLLLSTKAMGLGLNLTSASKVVIFDVEWNPSWDQQAQDRAYRIGQKNDVQVYRLVSQGTLDELRYLRQLYKVQLKQATLEKADPSSAPKAAPPRMYRGVQGDSSRKGELFGAENLFKFKDGCFLDEIWKKIRPEKSGRKIGGLNIHETTVLANELEQLGESKCDSILQGENSELDDLNMSIERSIQSGTIQTRESPERVPKKRLEHGDKELPEYANESIDFGAHALNHEDLFREDRGGAAVEMGEDGFDVELGGCSQNAIAIYEEKGFRFADESSDNENSNIPSSTIQQGAAKDTARAMPSIKEEVEDSFLYQKGTLVGSHGKPVTSSLNRDSGESQPETSPQDRSDMGCNTGNETSKSAKPYQRANSKRNPTPNPSTKKNDTTGSQKHTQHQQKPTVNIMGKPSTKKAETTFSIADLPIPTYSKNNGKKKKRKRKVGS